MYALVEHFLNNQGIRHFPQMLAEVREKLEEFSGFISLEPLKDAKEKNKVVILLKFDSLVNLKIWAKSMEHEQFIENLKPYMQKEYNSSLLEVIN